MRLSYVQWEQCYSKCLLFIFVFELSLQSEKYEFHVDEAA